MSRYKHPFKNRILSIVLALGLVLSGTTTKVLADTPETGSDDSAVYELGYHSGTGYLNEYVIAAKDMNTDRYYALSAEETSYITNENVKKEDVEHPGEYIRLTSSIRALKAVEVTGSDKYITLAPNSTAAAFAGTRSKKDMYELYKYSYGSNNLTFYEEYVDYVDEEGAKVYGKNMELYLGDTPGYTSSKRRVCDKFVVISAKYTGIDTVKIYDAWRPEDGSFNGTNIGCDVGVNDGYSMVSYYSAYIALSYQFECGYIFNPLNHTNPSRGFRGIASVYTRVCKHSHMEHHPYALTPEGDGRAEYYTCPDCGGVYTDAAAENETYEWLIPIIHNLEKHEKKDATCTEDGAGEEYYKCVNCGALFLDPDGKECFYNEGEYIIRAQGHDDADGDRICDNCGERLKARKFVKAADMSEIVPEGTYILVDANNKVMAKPEIDEKGGYPSMGEVKGITVPMDDNAFDYYKCKALNGLIFIFSEVPGISSQFEGSNDKAFEMHFDKYTMTCYGGDLELEPSDYTKYGMRIRMQEDGSALIGSVYDYWWEDAQNTDAEQIYFRSITDPETGEVRFVMKSEEGTAADKVYLYRMEEEQHEHEFGDWIRVRDTMYRECACGEIEWLDWEDRAEGALETEEGVRMQFSADVIIPGETLLKAEDLAAQMTEADKKSITDAVDAMTADGIESEVVSLYEIKLEKDGSRVPLEGTVIFDLPIPTQAYDQYERFMVVYINGEGEIEKLAAETGSEAVYFTADRFNRYAIIGLNGFSEIKHSVYGTFTGLGGDESKETVLQLIPEGSTEPAHEAAYSANTGSYSFEDVLPGTYTLLVTRGGYCPREYTVIVEDTDVMLDAEIRLYGDIFADGEVNNTDVVQLLRCMNQKSSVLDSLDAAARAYLLKAADIDGDGELTNSDIVQIRRYLNNKSSAFDHLP